MNAAQLYDKAYVEGKQLGYSAAKTFASQGLIYLEVPSSDAVTYHWKEMHQWCLTEFSNYNYAGSTFAFSSLEEAVMFKMRW